MKAAFEKHREETEGQIERLQQVFEIIGKRAMGKTCDASKSSSLRTTKSSKNLREPTPWMPV